MTLPRWAAALAVAGAVLLSTAAGGKPSGFPSFTSPLVDTVNVVPADIAQQVNTELLDYQQRSKNQIAVAIVHTTGTDSLDNYSLNLARKWGVGTKDKDNGVLLFIAYDDHKVRIEVGRGLEGSLTDLQSGRIIRDRIVPQMKEGNPGQAVLQGTQAIRQVLGDTQVGPLPVVPAQPAPNQMPGWLVVVIIIGLVGFVSLGQIGRRRRWPGFGGGIAGPIFWGGGFGGGGGGGGFGGGGGGGFGGGGGGGFGGGGASGGW